MVNKTPKVEGPTIHSRKSATKRTMDNGRRIWEGKIAVVTGASSGIGAATAKRLAKEGLVVILVARRQERLETIVEEIRQGGGKAHSIAADLRQEGERKRVLAEVESRFR